MTTYQRVVADYRDGLTVWDLARLYHLRSERITGILQAAEEACALCGILFRHDLPWGVAVLASGECVCQDCAELNGCTVTRWERHPLEPIVA